MVFFFCDYIRIIYINNFFYNNIIDNRCVKVYIKFKSVWFGFIYFL